MVELARKSTRAKGPARKSLKAMPRIVCPRCTQQMRLTVLEPMANASGSRLFFECRCGFEYRMSERAAVERSL